MKFLLFLLPALATQAGGIASAAALAASPPQLTRPADAIILKCPLKQAHTRRIDLSTGVARWKARGPTFDPATRSAGTVAMESAPPHWAQVTLPGARWVQPLSDASALGINPLPHEFSLTFDVLKSPGDMRIMLKGRVVADEKFQVDLFEPGPDNPSQGGMNADAPTPGTLSAKDMFDVDMLVGEPTGSKTPRPGRYTLKVTVENGADFGGTMGLLAKLELTQTCLNWGGGKKKLRGR